MEVTTRTFVRKGKAHWSRKLAEVLEKLTHQRYKKTGIQLILKMVEEKAQEKANIEVMSKNNSKWSVQKS